MNLIGQGTVTLFGIDTATAVANPTTLPADGTSTLSVTVTVRDREDRRVPDGTAVGLTVAPIYSVTSAGGSIIDGTISAADPRVRIFTTVGGQFIATFRAPTARGSGSAVIQVVTVDPAGSPTSLITTRSVPLQ